MDSGYRGIRLKRTNLQKKKHNQTCPLSHIQTGFPLIACEKGGTFFRRANKLASSVCQGMHWHLSAVSLPAIVEHIA